MTALARKMYIQYEPIPPLNLLGRVNATVTSDVAPNHPRQQEAIIGTSITGKVLDILSGTLVDVEQAIP